MSANSLPKMVQAAFSAADCYIFKL